MKTQITKITNKLLALIIELRDDLPQLYFNKTPESFELTFTWLGGGNI